MTAKEAETFTVEELWQDLLEKDDRTSPDDYPDMALITFEEFAGYLAAAPPPKPSGGGLVDRGVIARVIVGGWTKHPNAGPATRRVWSDALTKADSIITLLGGRSDSSAQSQPKSTLHGAHTDVELSATAGTSSSEIVERMARALEPGAFETLEHGYTQRNVFDTTAFLNAENTVRRARRKAQAAFAAIPGLALSGVVTDAALDAHEVLTTLCEWFGQRETNLPTTNSEGRMFERCSASASMLDSAFKLAPGPSPLTTLQAEVEELTAERDQAVSNYRTWAEIANERLGIGNSLRAERDLLISAIGEILAIPQTTDDDLISRDEIFKIACRVIPPNNGGK
jgi:hypothetical protein